MEPAFDLSSDNVIIIISCRDDQAANQSAIDRTARRHIILFIWPQITIVRRPWRANRTTRVGLFTARYEIKLYFTSHADDRVHAELRL